jgi:hypothetical protein
VNSVALDVFLLFFLTSTIDWSTPPTESIQNEVIKRRRKYEICSCEKRVKEKENKLHCS